MPRLSPCHSPCLSTAHSRPHADPGLWAACPRPLPAPAARCPCVHGPCFPSMDQLLRSRFRQGPGKAWRTSQKHALLGEGCPFLLVVIRLSHISLTTILWHLGSRCPCPRTSGIYCDTASPCAALKGPTGGKTPVTGPERTGGWEAGRRGQDRNETAANPAHF